MLLWRRARVLPILTVCANEVSSNAVWITKALPGIAPREIGMRLGRNLSISRFAVQGRLHSASLALLAAGTLPTAGVAAPACIPPTEVAHAKAVRVEKNGAIVLADGRAVHLESILLPAGTSDH